MKFLCVPCDSPMKLQSVGPPERGSLSVVYSCPECGYEMAMLTNAYETQIVQSLGVRIGPGRLRDDASTDHADASSTGSPSTALGAGPSASLGAGCPFTGMIPAAEGSIAETPPPVRWTAAAEARLAKIPEFVRPMARTGIERYAIERGASEVDEVILDAAREFFGM
jgi:Proto-chlorophyllide reductase 57 kD subunit